MKISAGSSIRTQFEAVCASPADANAFTLLLQAALLYQRYQVASSNPDLAVMLGQAEVAPSGDHLDVTMALTDVGLIQRNTFAIHM